MDRYIRRATQNMNPGIRYIVWNNDQVDFFLPQDGDITLANSGIDVEFLLSMGFSVHMIPAAARADYYDRNGWDAVDIEEFEAA